MSKKVLSYAQVQEEYPEAWEALTECYQADSCLEFYVLDEPYKQLFAAPKPGEEKILGNWECVWLPDIGEWVDA